MEGDGRARGGRRQKDLVSSWEQWLVLLNVTPSPSLVQSASLELQMLLSKTHVMILTGQMSQLRSRAVRKLPKAPQLVNVQSRLQLGSTRLVITSLHH